MMFNFKPFVIECAENINEYINLNIIGGVTLTTVFHFHLD